jgi:feruloyl-CoA synthase
VQYLSAQTPLGSHASRMTDRLVHWAERAGERTLIARRARPASGPASDGGGEWLEVSYGEALTQARAIAQALLARGLSSERPVVILSENGIEHALLALGCLVAGVPHCPVSPAYSLMSKDFEKLRHVMATITPGLVFASDARYATAIAAAVPSDSEVVLVSGILEGRGTTPFSELLATSPTAAVDRAMQATHAGTITKFLFTSGSTREPKAVINTHRMWCANQAQLLCAFPFLGETPPVLVDWLPWSHTFGGNHNLGLVLHNGGTLYIDDGKPTPSGIAETIRNLREIAPTIYFNVPSGFGMLANAMDADPLLRRNLLSRCRMFYYAGASLPQAVWDQLHRIQEAEIGERVTMGTGLGMTESCPAALYVTRHEVATGDLGLPVPGLKLKLVPDGDKTEIRYRGPNITPGYWRMPDATNDAFDDEGFLKTGDAVKWVDENDIHLGLRFDGRIAEDFKLATGTFVSVGPLRAKLTSFGAPYVQDVVLTGLNLNEVGALIFPTGAIYELAALPTSTPMAQVVESAQVQAHFQNVINAVAGESTGSASRIARASLMSVPPSLEHGELTDKGSINQRAVLRHRERLINALHEDTLPLTLKPSARP